MKTRKIKLIPYDPNWSALFKREAALVQQALGEHCIEIHHIGSTSIQGLTAKPVMDIMPVVQNIIKVNQAITKMQALGYESKGEYGIPFRHYFQKGDHLRNHHVHVFEQGNPEIERHLKFRNWLRTHEHDKQAYAQLKQELAQKFPYDINGYCSDRSSSWISK